MQLSQALRRAAQLRPGALATICGSRQQSFATLETRVAKLAGALHGLGVREGNGVAIIGDNSDRYVEALLAAVWAGAVITPIDCCCELARVTEVLNRTESLVVFVDEDMAAQADALLDACPFLRYLVFLGEGAAPVDTQDYEGLIAGAEAVAPGNTGYDELLGHFTTGDSSAPWRAAMLSQRNFAGAAEALMMEGAVPADAVALHAGPLSEVSGLVSTSMILRRAAMQVIVPQSDATATLDAIQAHGVTDLIATPTILQALMTRAASSGSSSALAMLARVLVHTSPSDLSVPDTSGSMPNANVLQCYGRTEHTSVATVRRHSPGPSISQPEGLPRNIGRPAYPHWIHLTASEGMQGDSASSDIGSLALHGACVMRGYLGEPEPTLAVLKRGWLSTGELATVDAAGEIRLVALPASAVKPDADHGGTDDGAAAPASGAASLQRSTADSI